MTERMVVSECIKRVEDALAPSLTWRGRVQWWNSPNRYLHGDKPNHALTHGHFQEVIEAAEALAEGDYL